MEAEESRRIGFVVNPIAGMGGRVGLKGTDGKVEEARRRGAEPRAPERARRALSAIDTSGRPVTVVTWGAPMGAEIVDESDLSVEVVGRPESAETAASDTTEAVTGLVEEGVDVILFVGGDGTAVDVAKTLQELGVDIPVIGAPAGVKIFSSVFAVSPEDAGRIAATYERTEAREIADLDEEAYREGDVRVDVRAVAQVPIAEAVQASKQLRGGSIEGLVAGVVESMDPGTTYFLGPGGTVGAIKEALGIEGTPLGVDVFRDGSLVIADATADDLRAEATGDTVIVVSPIGGQGFVFGRGNQQFAPEVIEAAELWIVGSSAKLDELPQLRVDTGDPDLDEALRGWVKVQTGRVERRMMEIV